MLYGTVDALQITKIKGCKKSKCEWERQKEEDLKKEGARKITFD